MWASGMSVCVCVFLGMCVCVFMGILCVFVGMCACVCWDVCVFVCWDVCVFVCALWGPMLQRNVYQVTHAWQYFPRSVNFGNAELKYG